MLFRSFFIGGFECSTHRLASGKRLDVVSASQHDIFARQDYIRLAEQGIFTTREGLRWHLIEQTPHHYDWSSIIPILDAARGSNTLVLWDLFHYGWPDNLDIFSNEFVERFAMLAQAFAKFFRENSDEPLYICPVNEISFVAWGGGDVAYLNPHATGRGDELKKNLVRASIAGANAVWSVDPNARLVQIDPVIYIAKNPLHPESDVDGYNNSQYAAWEMLAGRICPELGGHPRYLDIIGINFYPRNQWIDHGMTLRPGDDHYKPFRDILRDVVERFNRPVFIAETGTEDEDRVPWFTYIIDEVSAASRDGVVIEGCCLYPIINHPGWDDDRHCYNGLWDYANADGMRPIYEPLSTALFEASLKLKQSKS